MEILIGVLAFIIGGGVGFGISKATEKKDPVPLVVKDETSEKQQDIIHQLTNLDLILPLCNPNKEKELDSRWESDDQAMLCRYLACLQFSRGVDAKTGGNGECEEISNVMNKKSILKICANEDEKKQNECIEIFDRRL